MRRHKPALLRHPCLKADRRDLDLQFGPARFDYHPANLFNWISPFDQHAAEDQRHQPAVQQGDAQSVHVPLQLRQRDISKARRASVPQVMGRTLLGEAEIDFPISSFSQGFGMALTLRHIGDERATCFAESAGVVSTHAQIPSDPSPMTSRLRHTSSKYFESAIWCAHCAYVGPPELWLGFLRRNHANY